MSKVPVWYVALYLWVLCFFKVLYAESVRSSFSNLQASTLHHIPLHACNNFQSLFQILSTITWLFPIHKVNAWLIQFWEVCLTVFLLDLLYNDLLFDPLHFYFSCVYCLLACRIIFIPRWTLWRSKMWLTCILMHIYTVWNSSEIKCFVEIYGRWHRRNRWRNR